MSYNLYNNRYVTSFDTLSIGVIIALSILAIGVSVFTIIVWWKMFEKAGKKGWASLIPFYSNYVFFEITWGNGWYFLLTFLSFVPVVGTIATVVILILTYIKLGTCFGRSSGFKVGLVFLQLIFMAIIAFDDDIKYVGVDGEIVSGDKLDKSKVRYCSECGSQIIDGDSLFCPTCGKKL